MDRIYAEWRGGAHKNAWLTVLRQLEEAADPVAELRWLYDRAMPGTGPLRERYSRTMTTTIRMMPAKPSQGTWRSS